MELLKFTVGVIVISLVPLFACLFIIHLDSEIDQLIAMVVFLILFISFLIGLKMVLSHKPDKIVHFIKTDSYHLLRTNETYLGYELKRLFYRVLF